MKKKCLNDIIIDSNLKEQHGGSVALLLSYCWSLNLEKLKIFQVKYKSQVITLIKNHVDEYLVVEAIKNTMNIWALMSNCPLIFKNEYSPHLSKLMSLKDNQIEDFFKEKKLEGADFFKNLTNCNFEENASLYSKKENGVIDFIELLTSKDFEKDFNYENFKKLVLKKSEQENKKDEDNLSLLMSKYMTVKVFKYLNPEQKKDYLTEVNKQFLSYLNNLRKIGMASEHSLVWINITDLNNDFLDKMSVPEDKNIVFDIYKKFMQGVKIFVEDKGYQKFMGNSMNELFESLLNDSLETNLFCEKDLDLFESNKEFVVKQIKKASMKISDFNHLKRINKVNGNINMSVRVMDLALKKILPCYNPNIYAYDSISHKFSSDDKYIHFYIENNYGLNDDDYDFFCKKVLSAIMSSNFLESENLTEMYEIIQEEMEMRKDVVSVNKKGIVRKF